MKAAKRKQTVQAILALTLFFLATNGFAFGGKVTYPDGAPVVGAKVSLVGGGQGKETVFSDGEGRFEFPQAREKEAQVQIKAPGGTDYANVVLPAKMFEAGELAIILQPRGADQR